MVQYFEFSCFKTRCCCYACPVISYSSVPVTRSLPRQSPYFHRASIAFYPITCSAWETTALSTTQWVANLSRMFVVWVWACGRPERQAFAMLARVLWPLEYSQGMNSVTEAWRRHWIVLRGKTELIKLQFLVYTKMQNLNLPLGFHMLSTYFTPAKSWFLYH